MESFFAFAIDIEGLREGDGLPVGDDGNLATFSVAIFPIGEGAPLGYGSNLVGSHIDVVRHQDGEGHLGSIFHSHLTVLKGNGVASGGVGKKEGNVNLLRSRNRLHKHHLGHEHDAVAVAEEARDIGLYHQGFLCDEGTLEVAALEVVGIGKTLDSPTGEKFGNGEAIGGDTGAIGMEAGDEEGIGVEVGAYLYGLLHGAAVAITYSAYCGNNALH